MTTGNSAVLSQIDREILGILEGNGRITWQELGRVVSLSPNAAAERVRRLERRGVIAGFRAVVDPVALGRVVTAAVGVKVTPGGDRVAVERWFSEHDEVVEVVHLTGRFDYELRVTTATTAGLDQVLVAMKSQVDVAETETRVILRQVKP